jgi:hypothetical protein
MLFQKDEDDYDKKLIKLQRKLSIFIMICLFCGVVKLVPEYFEFFFSLIGIEFNNNFVIELMTNIVMLISSIFIFIESTKIRFLRK